MYSGNSLVLDNHSFNNFKQLYFFLKEQSDSNSQVELFLEYLENKSDCNLDMALECSIKKAYPILDKYFLTEHILYQVAIPVSVYIYPPTKDQEQTWAYNSIDPIKYSHWYDILDILKGEVLLKELFFIEALKYSPYYVFGIPHLDYVLADSNDTNYYALYKAFLKNCTKIKNPTNCSDDFFTIHMKSSLRCTNTHSNGNLRKKMKDFFSVNQQLLSKYGLFKTSTEKYSIPVYESYLFRLLFHIWTEDIRTDTLIKTNNELVQCLSNKNLTTSDRVPLLMTLFKNQSIFQAGKINIIQKYYELFTSEDYIYRLKQISNCINEEFIQYIFFDNTFINKFLQSDWPDCYIFIKQMLDSTIMYNNPLANATHYFQKKIVSVFSLMDIPFEKYLNDLFIARLWKDLELCLNEPQNPNILNSLETTIVDNLLKNNYFTTYYATPGEFNSRLYPCSPLKPLKCRIFSA